MANNLYFEVKADFLKTPLDAKLFKKDKGGAKMPPHRA